MAIVSKRNSHERLDTIAISGYKGAMNIDIEELRTWLRTHGKYRQIADTCGYAYDSLCKFADGRVKEPRLSQLQTLMTYRDKQGRGKAA